MNEMQNSITELSQNSNQKVEIPIATGEIDTQAVMGLIKQLQDKTDKLNDGLSKANKSVSENANQITNAFGEIRKLTDTDKRLQAQIDELK